MVDRHVHNGTDSPKISGRDLLKALQPALTTENTDTINTGDATSDTAIENMRTRIGEIESALQELGFIK